MASTTPVGSNLNVTWGTDNGPLFQNAVNACPANNFNGTSLTPFTSKGCVLLVPNGGSNGTGDYMFAGPVTMPTQVSFQIIGMGNSGKQEETQQAGVRFLTAMPITILSIGQPGTSNLAGFQLSNITFHDSSLNGSAIGGLLINGASEALIAYCSFENFNGQQTSGPSGIGTVVYSYGMKATSYPSNTGTVTGPAGFNNNIVLLHDKGRNNSIWYDGSNGAQDGPIVIGGDVFPRNSASTKPSIPPWGGSTPAGPPASALCPRAR
jgi:hypothetical protein